MEMEKIIEGKKVRFQLSGGIHYTGRIESYGNLYIRIRDIKSNIVFINVNSIVALEVIE